MRGAREIYASECTESLNNSGFRWKIAILIAIFIFLAPRLANAELVPLLEMPTPHVVLKTGDGKLTGPNGLDYRIPESSHILAPIAWKDHDDKFKLLQDRETRLTAENKSLRKSADEVPWGWIAVSCAVGIAAGTYVALKF